MVPDPRFTGKGNTFWACVRSLGQQIGYTERGQGRLKVPTAAQMSVAFGQLGLDPSAIVDRLGAPTALGQSLHDYFSYRAQVLIDYVEPRLMDLDRAVDVFNEMHARLQPKCPIPMNKQTGAKKGPAYFTGIINMLIEANSGEIGCNYDPGALTTFTRNGLPVRTMARRVDGCMPSTINPHAVWEIKEYYHTTTFGSRVAGGVYETLLDGLELEELQKEEGIQVKHLLMVDAHYTWWECGKPYLCRMVDMLHMGAVGEVLFGYEVVERLPAIVTGWAAEIRQQNAAPI